MRAHVRTSRSLGVFLVAALVVSFTSAFAEAGNGLAQSPEEVIISKTEPVYFSGDRFSYDLETGIVRGSGDVTVVQEGKRLRGDRVVINLKRKLAEIEGNVIATRDGEIIRGTRGVYDFDKETGVFHTARGHSGPWYVTADTIEREPAGQYSVTRSSLTTCDLEHPHYRVQSGSVRVVPDERLVARDLTIFAGRVPIFYFPYYSHDLGPRGSPFEFSAGTDSNLGAYARVGYNFQIGEEILLNPHIWGFTKSGVGGGLDGRLSLFDGKGQGKFDSFYVSDMNDDNTDESGVDKDRGKGDLYYRQELSEYWTALLQVEYISDRDFLKTFDFDDFGDRELPETFLNIERTGEHSVISFITRGRLVDYITDVERLPGLRLELLEQEVGDTGLFFSATNESVYLNVEPDGPQSARNFTQGRLAYPVRKLKWLTLVPFVEGDVTYYSDTPIEDDEFRLSGSAGSVAQSRFQKVYGSPFERYTAFRHLIVPTITYRFRPTPDEEPDELHQFDSVDLVDEENLLEVEVKNYLQAKRPDGARTELAQHIVTAEFEFDDGDDKLAELENELLIRPLPNWELALKALNDFRDERRADLLSAVIRYTRPESFKASLGVLHEDTVIKPYQTQVVYSMSKALGPLWRVGFEQRYDFAESEFTRHEVWVWRDLHCWEALLTVRDRREATSVMLVLNIKAFPMQRVERTTAISPIGERHPWPTRW